MELTTVLIILVVLLITYPIWVAILNLFLWPLIIVFWGIFIGIITLVGGGITMICISIYDFFAEKKWKRWSKKAQRK